jgi:hypothetical protein
MSNNSKNIKSIEKCVQEASKYINIHGKHYFHILCIYDKPNAKKMFNGFVKLFIKLQMFLRQYELEKKKLLIQLLNKNKILFDNIFTTLEADITQHQKVDILTIKIYTKILIKLFKKTVFNTNNLSVTSNDCSAVTDQNVSVVIINKVNNVLNPISLLKKNKKNLLSVIKGLKSIVQLFTMMINIFSEMQREYLQKINYYNLYDQSSTVNASDVEYNIKLITTSYEQLRAICSNKDNIGTNIFNDTSDTHPILALLDDGTTFVLCTIDNFRVRLSTSNGFKVMIVDIGTKQYVVKFLKDTLDNSSTVVVMKENFNTLKAITYAILLNQKLITYWLKVIKENTCY